MSFSPARAPGFWWLDVEADAGEETVAGILSSGGQAAFCSADVSIPEDAARAVASAAEQNGRIDILCNDAAYLGPAHAVLESTAEEWQKCIGVALMGTHHFTKAALPYMIEQKSGAIVNVVSIQAMVGCMTSIAYTSTKSALLGYTLSAAYDYGPHNIRVNSLCPGAIQTRISPQPDSRTTSGSAIKPCWAEWAIRGRSPGRRCSWLPTKPRM